MFSLARHKHGAKYRYNEPERISAVRYEMVGDVQSNMDAGGRLQSKRQISSLCSFFSVHFTHNFTFVFLCHIFFPTFFLFFLSSFLRLSLSILPGFLTFFFFFSISLGSCFLLISSFPLALFLFFLLPESTRGNVIADQAIMSAIHLSAQLLVFT